MDEMVSSTREMAEQRISKMPKYSQDKNFTALILKYFKGQLHSFLL